MKFLLATWGSRGDIEPSLAIGRELLRRGHDVQMAVPPDLADFTSAAGPEAVAFGPPSRAILDAHRNFWTCFFRNPWKLRELIASRTEIAGPLLQGWQDMSATLMSMADGADLILTGINFEDAAANVAEHYGIPLATLHYFPLRPNPQVLPFLPALQHTRGTPKARPVVTARLPEKSPQAHTRKPPQHKPLRWLYLSQSGRPDSNRRRPAWEAGILPTELRPQTRPTLRPPHPEKLVRRGAPGKGLAGHPFAAEPITAPGQVAPRAALTHVGRARDAN